MRRRIPSLPGPIAHGHREVAEWKARIVVGAGEEINPHDDKADMIPAEKATHARGA